MYLEWPCHQALRRWHLISFISFAPATAGLQSQDLRSLCEAVFSSVGAKCANIRDVCGDADP
jgi:hypothetical protein